MDLDGLRPVRVAWAAGFFEGEGSFAAPRGAFRLQIKNCDLEALERCRSALGDRGVIYRALQPGDVTT